jgi:AcrR family transcriptional regulator
VSVGPEEKPSTDRGRATRQAILDAAESAIAEFGYERASVAEITRRAGVAQGTFYIYFPDKKSVFAELVKHLNHKVRAASAAAVQGATTRQEMERQGFKAFFETVVEDPAIYRIIRQAEFVDSRAYAAHYETLAAPYTEGLRAAMAAGEIADDVDPELLAYILMGIGEFMGMKFVLWGQTLPEEAIFDQLMRFIERGLGREGVS